MVIACAATLHPAGISIEDGGDAARALEPLAGSSASLLFGLGILGAALLAAAIVPLSTAYSVCEAAGHPAGLDQRPAQAPLFYGSFLVAMAIAAGIVLVPAVPLVPVLYLTQVLNAVLLLAILPFMVRLGRDPEVLGDAAPHQDRSGGLRRVHRGRGGRLRGAPGAQPRHRLSEPERGPMRRLRYPVEPGERLQDAARA